MPRTFCVGVSFVMRLSAFPKVRMAPFVGQQKRTRKAGKALCPSVHKSAVQLTEFRESGLE